MKAVGLEVALLLLSGDVEVNPGPLGQGDLRFLHCELHPVSHKWYSLGVQLQIPVETLKCIRSDNHTVAECLLEMLTVWLQRTNPPPTWNMLTEALESPPVGEQQLTQQLRDKYCPRKEGGGTHCFPTQRRASLPSAPSAAQECLNTKPPPHNESMPNTFRESEEHSVPTAGCEGVKDLQKDCVSLMSGLKRVSVHSAPTTLPTTAIHQYQQSQSQPHPQHLYYPFFQPPHQHPTHQSPVQPHTYQPSHCPPFSTVAEQGYQYTDYVQPSYNQLINHNVNHQHSYTPTSYILHQYPYHQSSPFHQSSHQFSTHVHPSIHYPPLTSSNTPIGKYAAYLRAYYTEHEFTSTKWPHLDARKYIKLAVISNEYANREELERFRQQTIHGSIDDILEWKAPIEMKDILKPNIVYDHVKREPANYPVTQLLIEGAPGIGKSTFAWEVSQKWGQYQLFTDYSLLVLLNFRDKRVQEAKCISDLFYHPHPKLQSEIVDNIVLSSGHGLLLILEGFDEAPATKRTVDSIFVRLFRGQELPKATVILTTRPSASAGLRKLCSRKYSRRVEILGFGKKEIDEYIQCAFLDEQSRSDFKMYLSFYPYFHTMYVPLNSAIVVDVYKSCKSSGIVVPQTMTQLYSSLIRTLLLRYLKDKAEYNDKYGNIDGFKDLPQAVYNQFCEICKIAHIGIMSAETEIIFQDLPHDFDTLGLMQSCPELYVDRGASVSYNFLHLTLQEYLAAYHISQQSRDEQIAFMQEHIQSKKLEVVVKFLAGLTELGQDLWDGMRDFACRTVPPDSLLWKETVFIKLPTLYCHFESKILL